MREFTPEYWQEMIDEIMDEFDFDKVHDCMVALDWKWARCDGVPDKSELRRTARGILRGCVDNAHGGSGGFVPHIDRTDGVLSLDFVVANWDAYKE